MPEGIGQQKTQFSAAMDAATEPAGHSRWSTRRLDRTFLESPAALRLLYDTGFQVRRLARHCGVSVRTLERHLRRELGGCPGQWLRRQRMTEARRLLSVLRCVKTVALDLGYSQTAHFTVAFRDYWGLTPTAFLLAALGEGPRCRTFETLGAFSMQRLVAV